MDYLNKPCEKSIDLGRHIGYAKYDEINLPLKVVEYMNKLIEQVPLKVHFVNATLDGIGESLKDDERIFGEIRGWRREVYTDEYKVPFIFEHKIWGVKSIPSDIMLRVRIYFPTEFERTLK